ncbi:MAG: hypothetical protein P4L44_05800 [Oryzomonas sp.]|uniref:hypothetical protein n=1 Tax=Oryzomonas sp. TaxID=2855186 RepID=UPI00283F96AB|nr:hypothetical protein [Oryzomonas sp.]MDR3579453.1 hypothetical protein [Oryzomonas sp.]
MEAAGAVGAEGSGRSDTFMEVAGEVAGDGVMVGAMDGVPDGAPLGAWGCGI